MKNIILGKKFSIKYKLIDSLYLILLLFFVHVSKSYAAPNPSLAFRFEMPDSPPQYVIGVEINSNFEINGRPASLGTNLDYTDINRGITTRQIGLGSDVINGSAITFQFHGHLLIRNRLDGQIIRMSISPVLHAERADLPNSDVMFYRLTNDQPFRRSFLAHEIPDGMGIMLGTLTLTAEVAANSFTNTMPIRFAITDTSSSTFAPQKVLLFQSS